LSGGGSIPLPGWCVAGSVIGQFIVAIAESHDMHARGEVGLATGKLRQPFVSWRYENVH
jgi:hypothetical protein